MKSPFSVVLVDDDDDTREVFREFLSYKGIKVLGTGKNGKEGFELFKSFHPDVVLLDVMMPDYDGFYALSHIKKENPNAKVIMVTADKTITTENRLNELGATHILYKPYEIDEVIRIIQQVHENSISRSEENTIQFVPNI